VRSGGIGDPHPAGVPDEGAEVSDIVRGGQLVHPLGVAEVFVPRLVERAAVEQRAVGEAVNALAAPVHTDIQRNVVSARDGGLEAPPDVEGGRSTIHIAQVHVSSKTCPVGLFQIKAVPVLMTGSDGADAVLNSYPAPLGPRGDAGQVEDDLPRSDKAGSACRARGGRRRSTPKAGRAVVQVSQEMDTRLASASSSWASSLKARMTLPLAFRIASTLMSRASFSQRKSSIMPIDASIWAVVSVPLAARTQILNFGSVATLAYVPALASFGLLGSSEGSFYCGQIDQIDAELTQLGDRCPSSGDYKRNASSAAATTASAPSADVVSVEELFLPLPALTHRFELMQLRGSRSTLLMEIEQLRSGLQMVEELLTLAEQLWETDCK
uniref:Dynein_C domain-containing protein n=1 Tax=Macrostomum lignano TaxID=282301 RepID=A0A1I8F563_9PLAT